MSPPEITLKARAVRLLSRREHSRAELARKLEPYAESKDELERVLDDLAARGYLSDRRFAEEIIHSRKAKSGALKIAHELGRKGVPNEIANGLLREVKQGELETATALWAKRFGHPPLDARERAKQMRFLRARGFSLEVIRQLLRSED